jgi:hypothetical protein
MTDEDKTVQAAEVVVTDDLNIQPPKPKSKEENF